MAYQGPTRPGTSVETFRRTGRSVPSRTGGEVSSGGGSSRSRPTPTPSVNISGNTVFINGQGFSVAPALQADFIRSRTGSRGSSALAAIQQAESIARAQEAKRAAAQKSLEVERARLIAREAALRNQGARITRKRSIDVKTGARLSIIETQRGSEKIRQVTNLDTGAVKITSFGAGRQTGGIVIGGKKKGESEIQKNLKKVEKSLPGGVSFQRNTKGQIVNISDRNKGINYDLNSIVYYVSTDKLIAAGLITKEQEPKEKKASFLSSISSAFSATKWRNYREKQRQKYYDLYGLKGKNRNFSSLVSVIQSGKVPVKKKDTMLKYAMQDLGQDLMNPDVATRAEAAMIIATITSGPLIGAAIGTIYKTPIALAKDQGVAGLKDATWKDVSKKAGFGFVKNAAEAYLMMKLFGFGAKAISKIPVGGLSLKLSSAGTVQLSRSGMFTEKALKFALRKGLNVAGAQYLTSLGIDTAKTARLVKQKKYKAATVAGSALLGSLVGFYGERAVKRAIRKVILAEDPRLILTKGTSSKPFAVENRQITLARLNKIKKNLKGVRKIKFAKASPVREPRTKKIVTPEKRTARGVKIDVPTPSGYATYAVGKEIYVIPNTFLKRRPGNLPKTYYTRWFKAVKSKGLLPTLKELGLPRTYKPTIYKGSGEYLPRRKGESLKVYYARALKTANRLKIVQVVAAPKTVLGSKQPELEIKTIYPNPKGIKSSVTRVRVGKDAYGHDVVVEIVAPKSFIQRLKFKVKAKVKFKKEALKYLTNREAKIAKDLSPRMVESYKLLYVKKARGSAAARNHMLKVEQNFRRILKQYKIKASDAEIKAVSRLHDILKLRGINVKDEPIIRKAILEGYLNEIPLIKKLNARQLKRVADAIGFHQDVHPGTLKSLRLNKFTKAFMNADRLDIVRTGAKVNPKLLYNLKAKKIPKIIKKEFARLNRLKIKKKGFTATLRKKYNSLVKKYPGLKGKRFEDKIIAENKARYKRMSPAQKAKIRKQEKGYTDYKESLAKYKQLKKGKKVVAIYNTKKYNSYRSPKVKSAYRNGYNAGYKYRNKAPTNYKTTYGKYQTPYAQGYKDGYKGNYKINYKTGKYTAKTTYKPGPPKRPPKRKPPIAPILLKDKFKKRSIPKKVPVYYIKVKRKGRMVNLLPRPLILRDAKDYLAYKLDKNLVRTAYFEPIGKAKTVIRIPANMRGYFTKVKKKLRPYKIKVGKKKLLRNGYIEKRKFALDTKREKAQLKRARKKKK